MRLWVDEEIDMMILQGMEVLKQVSTVIRGRRAGGWYHWVWGVNLLLMVRWKGRGSRSRWGNLVPLNERTKSAANLGC